MGLFKLSYTSVKVSVAVNVEPLTPPRNPEPVSVSLTRPQGVCDSIPWSCRILSGGGPCHLGASQNKGYHFEGPNNKDNNKDYNILGVYIGVPLILGNYHLSWLKNIDGSFGGRQSKHPSILQDQPTKFGDTNMIVGPYASYLPSFLPVVIRRRVRNRPKT